METALPGPLPFDAVAVPRGGRGKSPGDGKGSSALGNGGSESAQPVAEKMEGEVEERVSGA